MVKVKSFLIRKSQSVALPRLWLADLGLQPGDRLDVYRDTENRLIIARPGCATRQQTPD